MATNPTLNARANTQKQNKTHTTSVALAETASRCILAAGKVIGTFGYRSGGGRFRFNIILPPQTPFRKSGTMTGSHLIKKIAYIDMNLIITIIRRPYGELDPGLQSISLSDICLLASKMLRGGPGPLKLGFWDWFALQHSAK